MANRNYSNISIGFKTNKLVTQLLSCYSINTNPLKTIFLDQLFFTQCTYLDLISVLDNLIGDFQNVAKGQLLQGHVTRYAQDAEHVDPMILGQGLTAHPFQHRQHMLQIKKKRHLDGYFHFFY